MDAKDVIEGIRIKPIHWIGSSWKDNKQLPKSVRRTFGYALFRAQEGKQYHSAKPLKGFGGAGVLEVVEDERGSSYRAIYTVRFADIVYVIHVFQKKSKAGIKTPDYELNVVRKRLKDAEREYAKIIKKRSSR